MKISKIRIENFRGITSFREIDFTRKGDIGNPLSAIIYGGNGSGKSTIVDAIEFCLQGRIERSRELENPMRPSVLHINDGIYQDPSVTISFDDGTDYTRDIEIMCNPDASFYLQSSNEEPLSGFNYSPIILRRSDILSYSYTRDDQKLIHLNEYFYNFGAEIRAGNDPEVLALHKKELEIREKRKNAIKLFSERTNIPQDSFHVRKGEAKQIFRENFQPKTGNEIRFKPGLDLVFKSVFKPVPKERIPDKLFLELDKESEEIDSLSAKEKKIHSKLKKLRNLKEKENLVDIKEKLLNDCERLLLPAFLSISNVDYVDKIELAFGRVSPTYLNITVTLKSGMPVSPNEIFSEANFDLLVLLLYISVIRAAAEQGQEKVLILDDVLQSVDSSIREKFMLYLSKELKDWQIIITCHDRLWLKQLQEIFNKTGRARKTFIVNNWSLTEGPVIKSLDMDGIDNSINQAIQTGNPRIIASAAGVLLENICYHLSYSLKVSVVRKRYDDYTLADLWEPVLKKLKKIIDEEELNDCIKRIEETRNIRNLLGCHYNEFAEQMDDESVLSFANNVQHLYDLVFCKECYCWIKVSEDNPKEVVCKERHFCYKIK